MSLALQGGFADTPRESARAYRTILQVMARPGRIATLTGGTGPAPLSPAAATLLLVLADPDTPVWLAATHDTPDIRAWLAFHTAAPLGPPDRAAFAVGNWLDLPLAQFPVGTAEYPDRSTTLIAEVRTLTNHGATLTGPGIDGTAILSLPDLAAVDRARFPLGLDILFTCGDRMAALPRSTRVAV